MTPNRLLTCAAVLTAALTTGARQEPAGPPPSPASRPAVRKLLDDYTRLYAGPTLQEWRRLLHPRLAVFDPRPDGSVRARGIEEFFAAQEAYFASGRAIHERLEHVRVEEGRRIARVCADFVFVDEGRERPGKLGLHLAEGEAGWQVVGILFSYDE